jgi:hypothetical protein
MPIIFELTRNQELLQQYYRLREAAFREEIGISGFDGSEESADRNGRLLIAHWKGRCLGGARISSRKLGSGEYRELELRSMACCTWERLVLDPEIRTDQLARDFCSHLIDVSRVLGYEHALLVSSLRNARYYRRCHSALGVDFRIHRPAPEYARGEFAGLEHYLSVSHLADCEQVRMVA